jgi:hypothetical protein
LAILGNLEIYLPPIAKLPESICIEMSEWKNIITILKQ